MNTIQRFAIAFGSLLLIVASLYPPWTRILPLGTGPLLYSVGYSPIWSPPITPDGIAFQIDLVRLAVEYVAILALTFGLVVVTAAKRASGSDASDSMDTGLDDTLGDE